MLAIAGAAAALGLDGAEGAGHALVQLVGGSALGALLALESLGAAADEAVAVVAVTVLLSVLAHGLTASPLAAQYGRAEAAAAVEPPAPTIVAPGRVDPEH